MEQFDPNDDIKRDVLFIFFMAASFSYRKHSLNLW